MNSKKPLSPKSLGRRYARLVATQLIYSWQQTGNEPQQNLVDFMKDFVLPEDLEILDSAYLRKIYHGVIEQNQELLEMIPRYLDRELHEIGQVELAILKYAFYELLTFDNLPHQVIINEAIEICKLLGAQDSYTSINACLDRAARELK